ncbi:cadmium resistance transporter [Streptococcus parauberis]|nr:cadmium resistance protein [Streptococcus satellite phage Javan404]GAJ61907.1 cadmium resistance transporter [Streptococcus parauberis]
MINTIITGIILYTGTAVDLLIILMIFFAKLKKKDEIRQIYLGQFLGSGFLIFFKHDFRISSPFCTR